MSSYWAPSYGTALVLNETEFMDFVSRYEAIHPLQPDEDSIPEILDNGNLSEVSFIPSEKMDQEYFYMDRICEDECDGMMLIPVIRPEGAYNQSIYDKEKNELIQEIIVYTWRCHDSYAIWATRSTSVFHPNHYDSYEELLLEFQSMMKSYLPEDFDWNDHIGQFSYAQYA